MAKSQKNEDGQTVHDQASVVATLEDKYLKLFNKQLQTLTRREKNVTMQALREIAIVFNTLALLGHKIKYAHDPQEFFTNFINAEK